MDDNEVIIPTSNDFNLEAEKTDELKQIEAEQQITQRHLANEALDEKFPLIRDHFEKLIEEYNNVSVLAGLPVDEIAVTAKARATIVAELKLVLHHIDEAVRQMDEKHARREE